VRHPIILASLLAGAIHLLGCTYTIGRAVTNVGAAGAGVIQVEKCSLTYNSFTYQYSTEDCQTINIQVMGAQKLVLQAPRQVPRTTRCARVTAAPPTACR
jgi:hypothetical protein